MSRCRPTAGGRDGGRRRRAARSGEPIGRAQPVDLEAWANTELWAPCFLPRELVDTTGAPVFMSKDDGESWAIERAWKGLLADHLATFPETLEWLSAIRLGADLKLLPGYDMSTLNNVLLRSQGAHIEAALDKLEIRYRATDGSQSP